MARDPNGKELILDISSGNCAIFSDFYAERKLEASERAKFNVTTEELKDAYVASNQGWRRPDDAWAVAPTPGCYTYADGFERWGKQPLHVAFRMINSVIKKKSKRVELRRAILDNKSSVPGDFHTAMSVTESETFSHSFSNSSAVNFGISLGINVSIVEIGSTFNYTTTWGTTDTQSKTVTIGSTAGVTLRLEPKQAVDVILKATKTIFTVDLIYEAYLTQRYIAYYKDKYHPCPMNDKHRIYFQWAPDRRKQITETVTISTFNSWEVLVNDRNKLDLKVSMNSEDFEAQNDQAPGIVHLSSDCIGFD